MLDGEKEIAVNQYQLIFKNIKKIQLDKYYKVSLNLGSVFTWIPNLVGWKVYPISCLVWAE